MTRDRDPAESIASVADGLYAVNFDSGQVTITSGKDDQRAPVGVGQPSLKIDGLTVGGTGYMPRRDRLAATR